MWQDGLVRRSKAGPPTLSPPAEPCPAGSGPSARGFSFRFHRSRISSRHRWSSSNANCLIATASASRDGRFDRADVFAATTHDDDAPASQIGGLLGIGSEAAGWFRQRPGLPARENHRPRPLIAWLSGDREEKSSMHRDERAERTAAKTARGGSGRFRCSMRAVQSYPYRQPALRMLPHSSSSQCSLCCTVRLPVPHHLVKREGRRDNFLARLEFRCSKRRLTEGML